MKKLKSISLIFLLTVFTFSIQAQLLKKAGALVKSASSSYTEKDAADAIKEALNNGITSAVTKVSVADGFFKNAEIKIPFPEDAKVIETKLRAVGLGSQVDKVILSINRAAEDASKEATPIFADAIKSMTVSDAVSIVKGQDDAATSYLKKTSTTQLTAKFQPVVKASLDKVEATKYWTDMINAYNKLPMVKKMNPDLNAYATQKAIDGLFIMVAKEELKIRKDPVARTTELLKKVFGAK